MSHSRKSEKSWSLYGESVRYSEAIDKQSRANEGLTPAGRNSSVLSTHAFSHTSEGDEDGGDERSRSQYERNCPFGAIRQLAMVRRADSEEAHWIIKGVFSVASLLDHNRPTQPITSPKAATSMVGMANHRR